MEIVAIIAIGATSVGSVAFMLWAISEGVKDALYLKAHRHFRPCLCGGREVLWFGKERIGTLHVAGKNNSPTGYWMPVSVSCSLCLSHYELEVWRPIYRKGMKVEGLERVLRAHPEMVFPSQQGQAAA